MHSMKAYTHVLHAYMHTWIHACALSLSLSLTVSLSLSHTHTHTHTHTYTFVPLPPSCLQLVNYTTAQKLSWESSVSFTVVCHFRQLMLTSNMTNMIFFQHWLDVTKQIRKQVKSKYNFIALFTVFTVCSICITSDDLSTE